MKLKNFSRLLFVAFAIMCIAPSCVKEGPMGASGADGKDGVDGKDGNVTCLECHKETVISQKQAEFAMSEHSVGAIAVDYAGAIAACAQCHSHQGFVQYATLGAVAGTITNPGAWECATCHGIHATFEGKDFALRMNGPVKSNFDNTYSFNLKANSNLCVNCHQTRTPEPNKAKPDVTFKITNTHYGPHHGPQGNVLAGVGFAEIPGSVAYPAANSSKHYELASCTGCHMAPFTKEKSGTAMVNRGGHSFVPSVTSCNTCHGGAAIENYNYGGVQTAVKADLDKLRDKLVELGVVAAAPDAVDPKIMTYTVNVGTFPMVQAQAYFNWIGLTEDRSEGVHNPKYVKALLANTLEALNK